MGKYSEAELRYCDPIATALIVDPLFRTWFVGGGALGSRLAAAQPDPQKQSSYRSKIPDGGRWWFNYWAGSGPGIETDILLVFVSDVMLRLALHVEVKTENDGLRPGQAEGYERRVKTWADPSTRPASVMPHDSAYSVYVAGAHMLTDPRVSLFGRSVSHEQLRQQLPNYPRK